MTRREFRPAVKVAAFERSGGVCECGCGVRFADHPKDRPVYDHIVPDALGGEPTLDNCACIRRSCHDARTHGRDGAIAKVAKAKRGERERIGAKAPARSRIAGSKGTRWKRKVDGTTVRRED